MLSVVKEEDIVICFDGYGALFRPDRHREFVWKPQGDTAFVMNILDLPVYTGNGLYDRPAGWYDKTPKNNEAP